MQFDQLKRREFMTLIGGATAWPVVARTQQAFKPVIGYLGLTSPNGEAEMISSFGKGLKESGFEEGRNVSIEFPFAEGNVSRLPALATELLRGKVAVIVAGTTPLHWRQKPPHQRCRSCSGLALIPSNPVWWKG